jgi:hypothetical protein
MDTLVEALGINVWAWFTLMAENHFGRIGKQAILTGGYKLSKGDLTPNAEFVPPPAENAAWLPVPMRAKAQETQTSDETAPADDGDEEAMELPEAAE